jgi:PAS domain S-box-containing protein
MDHRFINSDESLFDKIPVPVIRVRSDGNGLRLIDANAACHLLTGGKVSDLYNRDIHEIWQAPDSRHLAENIARVHASHTAFQETVWHTFVSDGQRRYVTLHYVPFHDKEVLVFVSDLTETWQKLEQVSSLSEHVTALFERASTGMLEGLPDKLADCNEALCRMTGFDKQELLAMPLEQLIHPEDYPVLTDVLKVVIENPYQVYTWLGRAKRKDGSYYWVDGSITGIVNDKGEFNYFLASINDATEREQGQQKLRKSLMDTVRAVSATAEIHDRYTAGHMDRVASMSREMGRELGFSTEELLGLSLGATIHDIGKVGIPASILSKPGKLSKAEFNLIQDHPLLGKQIIEDIDFPWPIDKMIGDHHERLDGSGYPAGLREDDISMEAKIVAVADVFEALVSHRPYRPGFELAKAIDILESEKGKLDPQLVECLLDLVNDGRIDPTASPDSHKRLHEIGDKLSRFSEF